MITLDMPPQVATIEMQQEEQSVQDTIFDFCVNELSLNAAGACGIMANIQAESEYNSQAGSAFGAYGLCQWCGSRRNELLRCQDSWSVNTQLLFLKYELENGYSDVLDVLQNIEDNSDGAYYAAYYFCKYFEIPSNVEWKANYRGGIAQEIWNNKQNQIKQVDNLIIYANKYFEEIVKEYSLVLEA